jgi:hypothetical protein
MSSMLCSIARLPQSSASNLSEDSPNLEEEFGVAVIAYSATGLDRPQ